MYSCQSLFVPVCACAARRGCEALASRRLADPFPDLVSPVCWRATVGHVNLAVFERLLLKSDVVEQKLTVL